MQPFATEAASAFRVVLVDAADGSLAELALAVLWALDLKAPGTDPTAALALAAAPSAGPPLLLLLRDAERLSLETAQRLAAALRLQEGRLHLVAAARAETEAIRALEPFAARIDVGAIGPRPALTKLVRLFLAPPSSSSRRPSRSGSSGVVTMAQLAKAGRAAAPPPPRPASGTARDPAPPVAKAPPQEATPVSSSAAQEATPVSPPPPQEAAPPAEPPSPMRASAPPAEPSPPPQDGASPQASLRPHEGTPPQQGPRDEVVAAPLSRAPSPPAPSPLARSGSEPAAPVAADDEPSPPAEPPVTVRRGPAAQRGWLAAAVAAGVLALLWGLTQLLGDAGGDAPGAIEVAGPPAADVAAAPLPDGTAPDVAAAPLPDGTAPDVAAAPLPHRMAADDEATTSPTPPDAVPPVAANPGAFGPAPAGPASEPFDPAPVGPASEPFDPAPAGPASEPLDARGAGGRRALAPAQPQAPLRDVAAAPRSPVSGELPPTPPEAAPLEGSAALAGSPPRGVAGALPEAAPTGAPSLETEEDADAEPAPIVVLDPGRRPEVVRVGPPRERPLRAEPRRSAAVLPAPAPTPGAAPRGPEILRVAPPGLLQVTIDAEPPARVVADGRLLGMTPITDARLARGLHTFRLEFEGGEIAERALPLDSSSRRLLFQLVPAVTAGGTPAEPPLADDAR